MAGWPVTLAVGFLLFAKVEALATAKAVGEDGLVRAIPLSAESFPEMLASRMG